MSPSFAKEVFENDEALAKFPLWIAHYTPNSPTVPLPWRRWILWQSTNRGRVRGIPTVVDIDWFNGTVEQLESFRRRAS